jgi:hydrogenase nickel insertion protein HypA
MTEIVSALNAEIKKHKFVAVQNVLLGVGELSFLGEEQLQFGYKVLTQENEVLNNSVLDIETIKAQIECKSCGYTGELSNENIGDPNDPALHYKFPKFSCPKCNGSIKVIEGRACIIKNITGTVKEE